MFGSFPRAALGRGAVLLVAVVAVVAVVVPVWSAAGLARAQLALDRGHMDIFYVSSPGPGALQLDFAEDVTGTKVLHRPEEMLVVVGDHAYTEGTSAIAGIERPTWLLRQAQQPDLPWPGWDTNAVRDGGFTAIDLTVLDISGPGTVFIWQQDTFGAAQSVTADGALWLQPGSVIPQPAPAHVHVNWGFDAPGSYEMHVQASGTDASGHTAVSEVGVYRWQVGTGAEAAASSGAGGNADGAGDAGTAGGLDAGHAATGGAADPGGADRKSVV